MKRVFQLFYTSLLIVFVSSCGEDGMDGDYYVKVSRSVAITSYWDNNPCLPNNSSYDVYYGPCSNTGTYSYEYKNGSTIWSGTYSVYINHGEDGGVFEDGDNGSDRYYILSLQSDGMNSSYYRQNNDSLTFFDMFEQNTNVNQINEVIATGEYIVHIIGQRQPEGSKLKHKPKCVIVE